MKTLREKLIRIILKYGFRIGEQNAVISDSILSLIQSEVEKCFDPCRSSNQVDKNGKRIFGVPKNMMVSAFTIREALKKKGLL